MHSYGLIVEGSYDSSVLQRLTVRVDSPDARVFVRECRGTGALRKNLVVFLRSLEFADAGAPVERALVFIDTDGRPPDEVEADLRTIIEGIDFKFPRGVGICPIHHELEAWLLADHEAINQVARARGGREVAYIQDDVEQIRDPKERLRVVLSKAKLNYTQAVAGEIAQLANLETLRYRLRCFVAFCGKI
ncbi:MAG: hypothetical protein WCC92_18335 [Candidatus Korobacteraceae bacterium]